MSKLDKLNEGSKRNILPSLTLNPSSTLGKIARPIVIAVGVILGGSALANCKFDTSGYPMPDRPDSRPVDDGSIDAGTDADSGPTNEICDDGIDNDQDGATDCDDLDCLGNPACSEVCDDGIDNDQDGDVDCADSDCMGHQGSGGPCEQVETSCGDGFDNDANGLTDCDDPNCTGSSACGETVCNDGVDNDGDGKTDCADSECVGQTGPNGETCEATETSCGDLADDDGDGDIDCQDSDCVGTSECGEICNDGLDNDLDGKTDCADHSDCDGEIGPAGITCAATEISCDDNGDNDGDGLLDCDDPDCLGNSVCPEICDDGLDNNGDGLTDCEDTVSCTGFTDGLTTCAYGQEWEVDCGDGIDNDGNGETDCDDIACHVTAACGAVVEDCSSFTADLNGDLLSKCEDVTCFLDPDCIDFDRTCTSSAGSLCVTNESGACASGTCSEGAFYNGQSIPKTCSPIDQGCY